MASPAVKYFKVNIRSEHRNVVIAVTAEGPAAASGEFLYRYGATVFNRRSARATRRISLSRGTESTTPSITSSDMARIRNTFMSLKASQTLDAVFKGLKETARRRWLVCPLFFTTPTELPLGADPLDFAAHSLLKAFFARVVFVPSQYRVKGQKRLDKTACNNSSPIAAKPSRDIKLRADRMPFTIVADVPSRVLNAQ